MTKTCFSLIAALQVSLFLSNTSAEEAPKDFKSAAQILKRECISCHGPELQMGELRLDRRKDAMLVIEPGKSSESVLVQRLTEKSMGILMPPRSTFPASPSWTSIR